MKKNYDFDEFSACNFDNWHDQLRQSLTEVAVEKISIGYRDKYLRLATYYNKENSPRPVAHADTKQTGWNYLWAFGAKDAEPTPETVVQALMNGADGMVVNAKWLPDTQIFKAMNPKHGIVGFNVHDRLDVRHFLHWWDTNTNARQVLLYTSASHLTAAYFDKQMLRNDRLFKACSQYQQVHCLQIDCGIIHRRGGSAELEIAFALSQAVYLINHYLELGYPIEQIIRTLFISTDIGVKYFLEIAKIRALRLLLGQVFAQYGCLKKDIYIHANVSRFMQSTLDKSTNIIRATSAALSAALGGVDAMSIHIIHDLPFAAERTARNISNLLKEESHCAKVSNPVTGTYYLEALTMQMTKHAWQSFQTIEQRGGFKQALGQGYFTKHVATSYACQRDDMKVGQRYMVGVNHFGNPEERFTALLGGEKRLSDAFEAVRSKVETYVSEQGEAHRPRIYYQAIGNDVRTITARKNFAANFFSWAGFKIHDFEPHVSSYHNAIIVLCGSDEAYKTFTRDDYHRIVNAKPPNIVFVVGFTQTPPHGSMLQSITSTSDRIKTVKELLTHWKII